MWLVYFLLAVNVLSALYASINGIIAVKKYYAGETIQKNIASAIVFAMLMYYSIVGIAAIFGQTIINT